MEFTINELLRVALGLPEITADSLNILYAVIRAILLKLKCENERIKYFGTSAACLKQLLMNYDDVNKPKFQYNNIEIFEKKINKMDVLAKRLNSLEIKLNEHLFEKRRKIHKLNILYCGIEWAEYNTPYEEICYKFSNVHGRICSVIHNGVFNCKLRRFIMIWLMTRIDHMEFIIQYIVQKLHATMEIIEESSPNMSTIEKLIHQITFYKTRFENNRKEFLDTTKEFNAMYICKLDRIQLPCLMNYLRNRFNQIFDVIEDISKINQIRNCITTKYHHTTNTCLSCNGLTNINTVKLLALSVNEDCKDFNVCTLERGAGLRKLLRTELMEGTSDYYNALDCFIYEPKRRLSSTFSNRSMYK